MVVQTRLNVTLYVHCLPCYNDPRYVCAVNESKAEKQESVLQNVNCKSNPVTGPVVAQRGVEV